LTPAQIRDRIGRRGLAAAALLLLALLAAVATPQLLGTRVAAALHTVASADPTWLWLAGIGFAISVLSAAGSAAPFGKVTKKSSSRVVRSRARWTSMNPPPPGPVSGLSHTHDTNAAATHASTAVPPASNTRAPACAVKG